MRIPDCHFVRIPHGAVWRRQPTLQPTCICLSSYIPVAIPLGVAYSSMSLGALFKKLVRYKYVQILNNLSLFVVKNDLKVTLVVGLKN